MKSPARAAAVWLAGFCSFLDLYAPQSILPTIRDLFGVGAVEASHMISATTLAVAVIAPFTGAGADMIGRKRVIVTAMVVLIAPTLLIALSNTSPASICRAAASADFSDGFCAACWSGRSAYAARSSALPP